MNMQREDATSLFFDTALLVDGWATNVRIETEGGCVRAIERDVGHRTGDEHHKIALPGLPNVHSHAFQRGMAGLAETRGAGSDSFWTWRDIMYRFVDRVTPDDMRAIAAMAYVEMLESGFTRVGEFHYLHHDRDGAPFSDPAEMSAAIAGAAAESGIALTLLPVFYAYSGFGAAPPGQGQRRFVHDLDGFAQLLDAGRAALRSLEDAVLGVAPHSLRAVSPIELGAVAGMVREGPVHIHIAEQRREVEDCIAWSGQRPVEWLLDHAPVDDRWCLVHATHVTNEEIQGIAASGATVGLCPITEANLGDGLFPAEAFLRHGGRYGIGSDSNVLVDATEELRLLEYGQRLARLSRNVFAGGANRSTGEALYRAALAGGAAACGAAPGIAPGLPADLISLDADHPSLAERQGSALLDGLIFSAGRAAIDCVWRRGRRVVSAGRHCRRDGIVRRYRAALAGLLA